MFTTVHWTIQYNKQTQLFLFIFYLAKISVRKSLIAFTSNIIQQCVRALIQFTFVLIFNSLSYKDYCHFENKLVYSCDFIWLYHVWLHQNMLRLNWNIESVVSNGVGNMVGKSGLRMKITSGLRYFLRIKGQKGFKRKGAERQRC